MKKKAILFDLDGTLLDTSLDFIRCVNELRARYELLPLPDNLIRSHISSGSRGLTRLALSLADDDPQLKAKVDEFLLLYGKYLGDQTVLFPGMKETLTWIEAHGLAWGIVTNKLSVFTFSLLEKIQLPFTPASIVCADHVTQSKPHPEPLLLACSQIGCKPGEGVFFGDHRRDIECANACGMVSVSCEWGYIETNEDPAQWGANWCLASASAIPSFLEDLL